MRKYFISAVFLLWAFCASSQEKVLIESSYGDDVPQSIRNIFMSALSSGLTNSGHWIVITNREEYQDKLSKELSIQDAGLIDDKQILEAGKASGADYVIYARIEMFDDDFFITFQKTELKTGISTKAPEPILTNRSGLLATAKKLAVDLTSGNISTGEKRAIDGMVCHGCIEDNGKFVDGYIDVQDKSTATWSDAVAVCEGKGEGWRLPTIDELKRIYHSQQAIEFKPTPYWTSSLRNNFSVYSIYFSDGSQTYISKSSKYIYRCVCAISTQK